MQLVRAAHRLRWAVWAGVVLAPGLTLAGLAGAWLGHTRWAGTTLDDGGLGLGWATALALAQGALVAAALFQLARLLGEVTAEQVFPPQSGQRFGRFAGYLFGAVLVHGVLPLAVAAWQAQARGAADLVLSMDAADLLALLVAAVLWLVARFFAEASRLEEDQRAIV